MTVPAPGHGSNNVSPHPGLSEEGVLAFRLLQQAAVCQAEAAQNAIGALGYVAQSVIASGGNDEDIQAALDSWHRRLALDLDRALVDVVGAVDRCKDAGEAS